MGPEVDSALAFRLLKPPPPRTDALASDERKGRERVLVRNSDVNDVPCILYRTSDTFLPVQLCHL